MDRGSAYKILASRLADLRAEGYDALLLRAGQGPRTETVELNSEPVRVEVAISWVNRERGVLSILATAMGPSTWKMERLDEEIFVQPVERKVQ